MIQMPRTLSLPDGDLSELLPVAEYECLRVDETILIDGKQNEAAWQSVRWSDPFVKMDTGDAVSLETHIALLWDDDCLYVAFRYEDHEIWGTHTEYHDHVYHRDSDAEIFIDGNGGYYELGVNPINTIYEVLWTWLAPVVQRKDVAIMNRLFSAENGLYFLPRREESLGRFGETDWQLPGIQHAVHIDGSLNNPRIKDAGWTVEFALPWAGLKVLGNPNCPPKPGDVWRIGASRCQHFRQETGDADSHMTGDMANPRKSESIDWSWNRHGFVNMHIPERWSRVRFIDSVVWDNKERMRAGDRHSDDCRKSVSPS
jgi:cellulose/xylan binding protein with CBM9 domain